MNANVVISLDTRRPKSDGTYPIILRLSHKGKTVGISTGYSIPQRFWDHKFRCIRKSFKGIDDVTRVNNLLEKDRAKAIDILTLLKERNELQFLSIGEVKARLTLKNRATTFFDFTNYLIDDLIDKHRIGNARSYKNVLREVKNFRHERDFKFDELNYQLLKKFESSYLSRGLSVNGLAVYMRTIRAIFNKAIREGLIEKDAYPFDQYTIKTKPTGKRAISFDAIKKIIALKFPNSSPLFDARNFFLISFYLRGASFIDMAFLTVGDASDGHVKYTRKKTGKSYEIQITPNLSTILNFYKMNKERDQFILPIIKRPNLIDQYRDISWAQNRYNKRLKEIARSAKIEENLTSYVSRHSFASIANNLGIPVTAISEMLGHEKLSTTQVYLASLSKEVLNQYTEEITEGRK